MHSEEKYFTRSSGSSSISKKASGQCLFALVTESFQFFWLHNDDELSEKLSNRGRIAALKTMYASCMSAAKTMYFGWNTKVVGNLVDVQCVCRPLHHCNRSISIYAFDSSRAPWAEPRHTSTASLHNVCLFVWIALHCAQHGYGYTRTAHILASA